MYYLKASSVLSVGKITDNFEFLTKFAGKFHDDNQICTPFYFLVSFSLQKNFFSELSLGVEFKQI